jgi:hypothetical protein
VLALAAASASFDGSVVAASVPKESPITMEVSNCVARRYVGCCALKWALNADMCSITRCRRRYVTQSARPRY